MINKKYYSINSYFLKMNTQPYKSCEMKANHPKYIVAMLSAFILVVVAIPTVSAKKLVLGLNITNYDGNKIKVNPGDTISITAGDRDHLRICNIHGDSLNPVTIINGPGLVNVGTTVTHFAIIIDDCSFFRFTGTGDPQYKYGIKIWRTPYGRNGLSIDGTSTNYEVDHIEVCRTGFAGICANPKPDCDDRINRGNFVRRNTEFHDNYIHSTAGEGLYIGHSFYGGYTITCDSVPVLKYPHELHGVKIYNNIIDSAGYDGIQVGCATKGCFIYNNKITNYGTGNVQDQKYGIILNPGTGGECYGNSIIKGTGTGIGIFGIGDNKIYNNLIVNPGYPLSDTMTTTRSMGMFCDDRFLIENPSFKIINNTIVSPKGDGIRFYSTKTHNNQISNNVILHPGTFGTYGSWEAPNTCYVNTKNAVDAQITNNYYSNVQPAENMISNADSIYNFCKILPIVDAGMDVTSLGVSTDFYGVDRAINGICDIGAFEYPVGTAVLQRAQSIKIIPRNSIGELYVYSEKKEKIEAISIYQLSGQLIMRLKPLCDNISIPVDSKLNSGIYLVCVNTENDECKSKISIYSQR